MRVVKRFFEKHLLFYYMVRAFFKTLLISLLALGALFGAMKISGKYNTIEGMLDLKYDSPWIIVPFLIAAILAVLSFIIGLILYLYKYKRSSNRGGFYKALSDVLNKSEKLLPAFVILFIAINGFSLDFVQAAEDDLFQELVVTPNESWIYYGQDIPNITYTIEPPVTEDIGLTIEIDCPNDIPEIGKYGYIITSCKPGYSVKIADDCMFEVKEYITNEVAIVENEREIYHVNSITLNAPNGYSIGVDKQNFSPDFIVVNTEETEGDIPGEISYYLRNESEYSGAISQELKYQYYCNKKPEIVEAEISSAVPDGMLDFKDFGIVTKNDFLITVTVRGTDLDCPAAIHLSYGSETEEKVVDTGIKHEGIYYYVAEFFLGIPEGSAAEFVLAAYAENDYGSSNDEKLVIVDANNHFVENYEHQNRVILDKIVPAKPDIDISYNNQNGSVEARGIIKDMESGVSEIEYKWNFFEEDKLIEYGDNSNSFCQENSMSEQFEFTNKPDGTIDFSVKINYSDIPVDKYPYELSVRITDNAGNVGLYEYQDSNGGRDTKAPKVISAGFRKKGAMVFDDTVNYLSFGNYAKEDIELVIVAQDISETAYQSGIKDVSLYDGGNGGFGECVQTMPSDSYVTGSGEMVCEYLFDIPLGTSIDDLMLRLSDNCNITSRFRVRDFVQSMEKNSLVVENDTPNIEFLISNSLNESEAVDDKSFIYNSDGKIWYNQKDEDKICGDYDGNFIIRVDDFGEEGIDSGISSILIYQISKSGVTTEIANETYDEFVSQKVFSIKSSDLVDGEYHYKAMVMDNAGNKSESGLTIYVDKENPSGKMYVDKPNAKEIDGKQWFDQNESIFLRTDIESDVSGIEKVLLTINGQMYDVSSSLTRGDGNSYFISTNIHELTKTENQEVVHKYEVVGKIIDFAGNEFALSPITLYVDCEAPVISRLTVEKKDSVSDQALNVLPFGVYSNGTLIVRAYASDTEVGSGIQSVKIKYDGIDEKDMTDEGGGVYSYELPADLSEESPIFQSNIQVTACDWFGKVNLDCPNLEDTEQDKGAALNFLVMLETHDPYVSLIRPEGDDIVQIGDEIWFNSNKTITVTAYDKDSGIRNVDIRVNGIPVTTDKNGVAIPGTSITETADSRDNESHTYTFDTEYFAKIAGVPDNGKYMVTVEVTDNAGNVNQAEEYTYFVDNIPPSINEVTFTSGASNLGTTSEFIEHLEYGYFFSKDFIANIHISDIVPTSGLNRLVYRLVSYDNGQKQGQTTGEVIISDNIASVNIPAGFKGQLFIQALDCVGNYSDEKTIRAFVIDDQSPEINISEIGGGRYSDANGNKLFTDDITLTVTITDTKSGISEVGYSQTSEIDGFERRSIKVAGNGGGPGTEIGDGWVISGKDVNLVTQISKTFVFNKDNNDVTLTFDAVYNSGNINGAVKSETFTIDKTDPIINVNISKGINDTVYYNAENKAIMTIDVTERNFDAGLIQTTVENTFNGYLPTIRFEDLSVSEHRAIVTFREGDYSFSIEGVDLGGRSAQINLDYEKVKRFYVDETVPIVDGNFSEFTGSEKRYFNTEKTAVIEVTEHNFDPDLAGLKILRKDAGKEHNERGFTDVTYLMTSLYDWSDKQDVHTLTIECDQDAIYCIEISPSDMAGNYIGKKSTGIFEIDTTPPALVSVNGSPVKEKDAVEFLHIYPYDRRDELAPTIEFMDINFDYIKYGLTVYTPEYENGKELASVEPVVVYLDTDENQSCIWNQNLFTLPNFTKDGVYALELTAVDKAGNESALNSNTYMRMVDSDVLAYISNSNAAEKTGWYSLQYENGESISKRPDNFSDLEIVVLAKKDSEIEIVLRDYNGDEKDTELRAVTDDSMYGVCVYRYVLKAEYFKENYQEDTDVELYLSVKNEGRRIDLGKVHIDNIPPSCILPEEFRSWNWYYGLDARTITITEISELLDETKCKVYDNGKEIDFIYASEDGNLSFTLESGWHNVGVKLEDVAGNIYSIREVNNIHIGYFWFEAGVAVVAGSGAMVIIFICFRRISHKKKRRK